MVPLPPLDAVMVVLPQKVPAPLAVTVVGSALTVMGAVLLSVNEVVQPEELVIVVKVKVLEPIVSRSVVGKFSVPVLVPIVSVAVFPFILFAPLKL